MFLLIFVKTRRCDGGEPNPDRVRGADWGLGLSLLLCAALCIGHVDWLLNTTGNRTAPPK